MKKHWLFLSLLVLLAAGPFGALPKSREMEELKLVTTLALDGEREIEFSATDRPSITLDPSGPFSVDVPATLAYAARHRLLAGQRTPMTP